MWSSNFLLAYTLQKLNREKRERQPNWTESEKQLLLSLTKKHQFILENKGSDTMTIKRKSEAWDEIALRMNAAGYNRSKERLKQQLGRIRAAEAKKMKDAIERNLSAEQIKNFKMSDLTDNSFDNATNPLDTTKNEINNQTQNTTSDSLPSLTLPMSRQEQGLYIKIEETPAIADSDYRKNEITTNYNTYDLKSKLMCTSDLNTSATGNIIDNMHFTFQNVQSLAKFNTEDIDANKEAFGKASKVRNPLPSTSASVTSQMTISRNNEDTYDLNENNENSTSTASTVMKNRKTFLQKRNRLRRIRLNGTRTLFTNKQCMRQLHLYRIAVERERLRNIKLQQKRDRILYRKDVEIQNLKLQILRNLTNQNRDTNRINF